MSTTVIETTPSSAKGIAQALVDQLNVWAELPRPNSETRAFTVGTLFAQKYTDPTTWWAAVDGLLTNVVTLRYRAEAAAAVGTAAAPGPLIIVNGLKLTEVTDLVASGYVEAQRPQ